MTTESGSTIINSGAISTGSLQSITTGTGVSNTNPNYVNFAVYDTLETNSGSVHISFSGYTDITMQPWSTIILNEDNGALTYWHEQGTSIYTFPSQSSSGTTSSGYLIKATSSSARVSNGTVIEVSSSSSRDAYKLISGSATITNGVIKHAEDMKVGDILVIYSSGKEGTGATTDSGTTTGSGTTGSGMLMTDSGGTMTDTTGNVIRNTKRNISKHVLLGTLRAGSSTSSSGSSSTSTQDTGAQTSNTTQSCSGFQDVSSQDEWCSYVTTLLQANAIKAADQYRPDDPITRAELLKIVMNAANVTTAYDAASTYDDVSADDWWAPYVSTAKKKGYISANNSTFRPTDDITRAEAIKILLGIKNIQAMYDESNTYDDISPDDWWAPYVSTAKKLGYISATNSTFRPNDTITRGEAAKMIVNIFLKDTTQNLSLNTSSSVTQ